MYENDTVWSMCVPEEIADPVQTQHKITIYMKAKLDSLAFIESIVYNGHSTELELNFLFTEKPQIS